MMVILAQSGLKKVVTGKKPENLNKTKWEELDKKALSAIQLCLANTILQEVLMEKSSSALWKRLETLYATKSLVNRLVLKQRLFTFRMNEGSTVTGEIRRPSSVTESKSTRLERRQLGHRREKCMFVSLKRGSLLDAGFEKLGHCVRENQTQVSFDLAVYKSKARSLLVSKHRFDLVNSLHSSR
ncbi:hypothetical protein Gotur_009927 [Gossypium turneri]